MIYALYIVLALLSTIPLYFVACLPWFAWMRPFYCKVLPWHSPGPTPTGFDGCSVHARCLWCGYEGMIDSQGNLF